jgi:hypothetical protein
MADFPDHLATDVGHVGLSEDALAFTAREGFEGLACEHATVVAVFLLRMLFVDKILPTGPVEWLLFLVLVFLFQVLP